jgi:F420-dependent oxidoreductase-like protein
MRIGYYVSERGSTFDEIVANAKTAATAGFPTLWSSDVGSWDALVALAVLGREVPGVELATGVVVSHSRPPLTMAAQALTVQAATGNRLTLGVGVSHQYVVEAQFGASFERPARHLREYLSGLVPLLRGESVDFQGETLRVSGSLITPGTRAPSVLVGALGPAMLRVAGELADGTVTAWAGPRALGEHVVPSITKAAAGRPAPRVVASSLVSVTSDAAALRASLSEQFSIALDVPHYRATLDREGVTSMGETAIVGDEAEVTGRIKALFDAGATELMTLPCGSAQDRARTVELLADLTG